ncbi:MAG: adenosine deaminase [Armatimonadota bacterium]
MPKVELHLHLEGAIPHGALWALVQKYGGDPSVPTIDHLSAKFTYRDFPHFIETWVWKNQFLREYEDFEFVAAEVARDLIRQNIQYVEAFYSPGDFRRHGLDPQRLAEAIRKGLNHVAEIEVALVADLVRDNGPEQAHHTLDAVREAREFGIIGIGIGGSEERFPPEAFEPVYERARRLGFRTTAHAGEAAGPESVWGAIRALRVDRIGHGTRAVEDAALIGYLSEHQVSLELCVISNQRTGVIESVSRHPARLYFDRGIPLSINTDDPKMFGNSLAEEYLALQMHLGFSMAEIQQLVDQAIETSWLPLDRKRELIARFQRERASVSLVGVNPTLTPEGDEERL